MVYARELNGGEVIEHHLTRAPLHVETTKIVSDPAGLAIIIIAGHHASTGVPLAAEHSADLYLTEAKLTSPFVVYRGSMTDQHGVCRVLGPCLDNGCKRSPERRYALQQLKTGLELWHVREASFTAHNPICQHCGSAAGQLI